MSWIAQTTDEVAKALYDHPVSIRYGIGLLNGVEIVARMLLPDTGAGGNTLAFSSSRGGDAASRSVHPSTLATIPYVSQPGWRIHVNLLPPCTRWQQTYRGASGLRLSINSIAR